MRLVLLSVLAILLALFSCYRDNDPNLPKERDVWPAGGSSPQDAGSER